MPGITHWQSPGFFAYFPANTSFPSLLAEMLSSALGAQCMKWETSPAATELEEAVMNWLRKMTGLPSNFEGVIQDTASTSTLCAILTAREKSTAFDVNNKGMAAYAGMRVYCSSEAHSSVEKAVKIAGIGRENLVKIGTDNEFRMDPALLEKAIARIFKTDSGRFVLWLPLVQPVQRRWIRLRKLHVFVQNTKYGCTLMQPMPEQRSSCLNTGIC